MLVSVSHMRIFVLTEMRLQVELRFGRNGTVCAYAKLELPWCSRERETGQERIRDCMELQALNASHALAKHCSDAVRYFSEMLQGMVHHVICNNFFVCYSFEDHSKYDRRGR